LKSEVSGNVLNSVLPKKGLWGKKDKEDKLEASSKEVKNVRE
jgi:hypothetical protein